MKVKTTEKTIELISENDFEKQALKVLKQKGVKKISFSDSWEGTGPLILELNSHEWDD